MTEQGYQSKIIKDIERIGGIAINGNFSKKGTADLICGYPIITEVFSLPVDFPEQSIVQMKAKTRLLHLHIEVKTPKDYDRVMRSIVEIDGQYEFNECTKSLKEHEYLQITKLNLVRKKGGLGLIAHSFEQVVDYVKKEW